MLTRSSSVRLRSVAVHGLVGVLLAALGAAAVACENDSSSLGPTLALDASNGGPYLPGSDAGSPVDAAAATPDAGGDGGLTVSGNVAIDLQSLGANGFDYQQGSYSLGWTFVAQAPIRVTALGFYDDKKDGLTASHPVAIYDKTSQTMLATVTVSPTDALDGYFRYAPLASPLTLTAGKAYVILALVGDERYVAFNSLDPSWTVNSTITYSGGAVNYANDEATTLLYPDTFDGTSGDFGPNFKFTTE